MTDFESVNGRHTFSSLPRNESEDAVSRYICLGGLYNPLKIFGSRLLTIFKPEIPAKLQRDACHECAGFMTLPRELRDKIYDYFLRMDRFLIVMYGEIDPLTRDPSKLDLSILRVNKTIFSEASRTIYEENPWVCITIEKSLLETLCDQEARKRKGFPGDRPVPVASYARNAAIALSTIHLQRLPRFGPAINRIPLLVPLFAMPRLCRILTAYHRIREIDITVRLNPLNAGKVKGAWAESLLDYFQEARGFGRVTIFDVHGNQSHVELATLMMSPFKDYQEIFDRVITHRDRARQKQELGQISEARCDSQDGRDFILWFRAPNYNVTVANRSSDDRFMDWRLSRMLTTITFACAFLSLKLGDMDWALSLIYCTLDREPIDANQAKAWSLYGLRDMMIGACNGAVYCFLQVLRMQPGDEGVDNFFDAMELRLQSSTKLTMTERIILHNIQNVLQPFRHQEFDSPVMSEDKYQVLMKQWYIGMRCVDSIGYRHSTYGAERLPCSSRRRFSPSEPYYLQPVSD